jgi:hypothetical protein
MTEERLYHLSCRTARELLAELDRGDSRSVHQKLGALRHYLTLAEITPAEKLRGDALYRREQLELLAAVTERLGAPGELETAGANRNLLRHLVSQSTPGPRFRAAGCI